MPARPPPSYVDETDVCACRIKKLQHLCRSRELDALLFVPGQDGRDNWGSQVFVNYALLGQTGRSLGADCYIAQDHEALEDAFFLVLPDGICVFYIPPAAKVLQPLLARLNGVREWSASIEHMADSDQLEKRKIETFINMMRAAVARVHGVKKGRIGVTLPPGSDDVKDLELWPLIQAHALDEMGGHGFFTASYDVEDITADIKELVTAVDCAFVNRILAAGVPTLRHHVSAALDVLDTEYFYASRSVLTEDDLSEPLNMLYEFGHVKDTPEMYEAAAQRAPRVLLGERTALVTDLSARASKASVVEDALHMVLEGEDPASCLRICRTYFLQAATLPDPETQQIVLPVDRSIHLDDEDIRRMKTVTRLHGAYQKLVTTMKCLSDTRVPHTELHEFLRGTARTTGGLSASELEDLIIDIDSVCTISPSSSSAAERRADERWCIIFVRLVLRVGSEGAVAVGDTALYTPGSAYQLLTDEACAPYFRALAGKGMEDYLAGRLTRAVMENVSTAAGELDLGKPIGALLGAADVLVPSDAYPVVRGQLRIFDTGLALVRTGVAPLVISFSRDVSDIRLCDAGSTSLGRETVVLQIRTIKPVCGCVPFSTSTSTIGLVLASASSLAHAVFMQLPAWRMLVQARHGTSASNNDGDLAPELSSSYAKYLQRADGRTRSDANRQLARQALEEDVEKACIDLITSSPCRSPAKSSNSPLVSLFVGLPGSGVTWLAKQVERLSEGAWRHAPVVLEQDLSPADLSRPSACCASVSAVLDKALQSGSKRVLLSVSGTVSLPLLAIHLIQRHGSTVRLASASTCINLELLYEHGAPGMWLPCLWDQAREGWCSTIVVFDCSPTTKPDTPQHAEVMHRLPMVNRGATVLRATRVGVDPMGFEDLLATDRFDSAKADACRRLNTCPSYRALDLEKLCRLQRLRSALPVARPATKDLQHGLDLQRLLRCLKQVFPAAAALGLPIPSTSGAARIADGGTSVAPVSTGLQRAKELAREKVMDAMLAEEDRKEMDEQLHAWSAALNKGQAALQAVTGIVIDAVDSTSYVLEASRQAICLTECTTASDQAYIEVHGASVDMAKLVGQLISFARPYERRARPLRLRASVSQEEVGQLLAKAQAEQRPLPSGWWFDGGAFIDVYGMRLQQRPDVEDLVAEFLEHENSKIKTSNGPLMLAV